MTRAKRPLSCRTSDLGELLHPAALALNCQVCFLCLPYGLEIISSAEAQALNAVEAAENCLLKSLAEEACVVISRLLSILKHLLLATASCCKSPLVP